MARQSVHQRRRALPEVPHDRRSEARCARHGAQFHGGQRAPEARLDQALDSRPGADEPGHGHAVAACSGTEGDRWVFAGPTPASFNGYQKDHADLLVRYMFQFTPEELVALAGQRGRRSAGS